MKAPPFASFIFLFALTQYFFSSEGSETAQQPKKRTTRIPVCFASADAAMRTSDLSRVGPYVVTLCTPFATRTASALRGNSRPPTVPALEMRCGAARGGNTRSPDLGETGRRESREEKMDRGGGSPSSTPGSSYPDAVDKGRGEGGEHGSKWQTSWKIRR